MYVSPNSGHSLAEAAYKCHLYHTWLSLSSSGMQERIRKICQGVLSLKSAIFFSRCKNWTKSLQQSIMAFSITAVLFVQWISVANYKLTSQIIENMVPFIPSILFCHWTNPVACPQKYLLHHPLVNNVPTQWAAVRLITCLFYHILYLCWCFT